MADQSAITLEEFKARLPLVEIVGRYVKLTRRGREHLGLCPFHKEKTPSFNVVEDKGFYHCFGCGAHGTAIDFVMEIEGLGLRPRRSTGWRSSPACRRRAARRDAARRPRPTSGCYAANAAAARLVRRRSWRARRARRRAAYLERRGLDRDTIRAFELGYAPDDRQRRSSAPCRPQGFAEAELLAAGLLARREDGGPSLRPLPPPAHVPDRRRARPDRRLRRPGAGRGARQVPEHARDRRSSTRASCSTTCHRAQRRGARAARTVIAGRGLHGRDRAGPAGLAHAVAPLGTAVTERQLATALAAGRRAPVVCLDGDRAGLARRMRAAERALPLMRGGQSLRFAAAARRRGPRQPAARRGARGAARCGRKPTRCRIPLAAGDRRPQLRDARAPRGLRAALPPLAQSIADRSCAGCSGSEIQQRLRTAFAPVEPRRRGRGGGRAAGRRPGSAARRLAARLARPELADEASCSGRSWSMPSCLHGHRGGARGAPLRRARPGCAAAARFVAGTASAASLDARRTARHLRDTVLGLIEQLLAHRTRRAPVSRGRRRRRRCSKAGAVRVARHRRFAERRAVAQAVSAAVAEQRDDAGARVMAVDRLLNSGEVGSGRGRAKDRDDDGRARGGLYRLQRRARVLRRPPRGSG